MRVFRFVLLLVLTFDVSSARAEDKPAHWAFKPIPHTTPPQLSDSDGWTRNSIDAFVLQRLHREGVKPSPASTREQWLRRVTLDLTGLPPKISEIDEFLADPSDRAYEKVVDRLLASAAYGERMTLQWLDLARYADTYGYDNDGLIRMWPWRDWALRAFTQDLPYDDFIRWQLAGDLLPSPTRDQMLATGFNRLHRQNAEGGVIPNEFVVEYVVDRVQTFGNAFLGLSLECARCHDHKFDPISQRDFYSVYALFGNIDELGTYPEKTRGIPTPNMPLYEGGQEARHEELKRAIADSEGRLREVKKEARRRFPGWRTSEREELDVGKPIVHLSFESEDGLPATARSVPGPLGNAIRFSGDTGVELKNQAQFERTDSFTMAAWLRPAEHTGRTVVWHNSKPIWEVGGRGYELAINGGHIEFTLCHVWPGNAVRVRTRAELTAHQWTHVSVTYNGSSRADGVVIYLNAKPMPVDVVRDHLYATIRLPPKRVGPLVVGARRSETGFIDGEVDEFVVFDRSLTRLELTRLAGKPAASASVGTSTGGSGSDETTTSEEDVFAYYIERIDKQYRDAREQLKNARRAESEFADGVRRIMVMRENTTPAAAYILRRGAYDRRGAKVGPGAPEAILPAKAEGLQNRLDLAEWLVRRDHPLTARVAVNRLWQTFFGIGLVETPDDFGSQGSPPSHPELLDHLAGRFIEDGWDIKAICKSIALSSTYRQDSAPRSDLAGQDPHNRLLARGPRHRLGAEQIRDAALAVSDVLTKRIGGPSVKPYQPPGLWEEVGPMRFKADTGSDLYRKSMYTFWKRTAPPPTMLSFDAVSREVCVANRDSTVTPLQALVLLNDPQFVEASRVLAATVVQRHKGKVDAAIEEVFRRLTGRRPRIDEASDLLQAHNEQRRLFSSSPNDAKAYISVGEWPQDKSSDVVDVAAMTAVVQLVMSFHEFQVKS